MTFHLHDSEITGIRGCASDADDIRNGLSMERVKFTTSEGECVIWLTREQCDELREALDVLYPPATAAAPPAEVDDTAWCDAVNAYADAHGHEHAHAMEGAL